MKDFNKFNKIWNNPQLKYIFEAQQQMYQTIEHTGLTKILENNRISDYLNIQQNNNLNHIIKEITGIQQMAQFSYKGFVNPEILNLKTGLNNYLNYMMGINTNLFPQLEQFNDIIKSQLAFRNFLNSTVYQYNHTKEEQFEVVFEDYQIPIIKPSIKILVKEYIDLNLDIETAIKMAIASYIFIQIYFYLCLTNLSHTAFISKYIADFIYSLGNSIFRHSVEKYYELQNPDKLGAFIVDEGTSALFGFIIGHLTK